MSPSSKTPWRSFGPEHVPAVVSLFAVIAAYFYFAGSQYLDSKARALGLAGDPGEAAFQKTTSLGAVVVFTSPVFLGTLIVSLLFLGLHMTARKRRLERLKGMEEEIDANAVTLDEFDSRLIAIKVEVEALEIEGKGSASDIEKKIKALETEKRAFKRRHGHLWRKLWWARVSRRLPGGLEVSAIVAILGTFLGGAVEGDRAAQALKREVSGSCAQCLKYEAEGLSTNGRPAFQTSGGIFVLGTKGLVLFRLDKGLRVSAIIAPAKKAGPRPDKPKPTASPKQGA